MSKHRHSRREPGDNRRGSVAVDHLREQFTTDTIADAMVLAGIDQARVYAFRKTGLIPTKEDEVPPEWDAALEEYDRTHAVTKGAGA